MPAGPGEISFDDPGELPGILRREVKRGDGLSERMAFSHNAAHQFVDGIAMRRAKQAGRRVSLG